jgi:hypothetical protein
MNFMWWCTAKRAKEFGATHYAWSLGIVPGFFNPETNLWVSRADWLNPVEDLLIALWRIAAWVKGAEPQFMFALGKEIEG